MKTIEEGMNEAYKKSRHNAYFGEGFNLGVEFAQRWIPIEDELPEIKDHGFSDTVLTKNSFGNLLLERYDMESKSFNAVRYDALKKGDGQVTHWRPIEYK